MQIIAATLAHLDGILRLSSDLNTHHAGLRPDSFRPAEASRAWITRVIESGDSDVLVAFEDGRVLGFALLDEDETPPYAMFVPYKFASLIDLAVDAAHRSRGIGTALLDAAEAWAAARGLAYVELSALPENDRAVQLYERVGFEPVKITMRRMVRTEL